MKNYQFALSAIENCKEFDELSQEEKGMLAVVAEVIEYEKGHKIFSMDQAGDKHFYVICSGRLSLTLKDKKALKKELTKGDLFGEIAVFSEKHRLGTIECLEASVLLAFDRDKIMSRELISAQVALKVCIILTRKIASYFYADGNVSTKQLISLGEGETVEFKKALNENKVEIVQTIT
ncbi:MAG: cyclic nucleotide-binding domain-containing protein, partial [Bacteroidota bacterium]